MADGGLPYPVRSLRKSRSMSALGTHQFEERIGSYIQHLLKIKSDICNICEHVERNPISLGDVSETQAKLQQHYNEYITIQTKYRDYLRAQRSVAAMECETSQTSITAEVSAQVTRVMNLLKSTLPESEPTCHRRSVAGSASSRISSHSSTFLKYSQRVATAKARLKYADEEATIIKKEAELKASRKILKMRRELEEAKCNLEAVYDNTFLTDRDESVRSKRVQSYVHSVNDLMPEHTFSGRQVTDHTFSERQVPDHTFSERQVPLHLLSERQAAELPDNITLPVWNTNAAPFVPKTSNVTQVTTNAQNDIPVTQPIASNAMCDQFAKVFAKKDLISKKHVFDDNPQNYATWKASFQNAVCELDLSTMEEMDLLIQWLGDTSSANQAKSIRNANASNPKQGLKRIWERLEDRFML